MLLGEPQRTAADLNFVLFGIPIRIHPVFWLLVLFLGRNLGDAASVLTWVAAVLISILVHELGHALVMRAYGYAPWIVLCGFGGLTCHDCGRARGTRRSESVEQILISLAGPAAGFLLAAILVLGVFASKKGDFLVFYGPLHIVPVLLMEGRAADWANWVFLVSVLWGLINLLPIYPLDGGQIAREMLVHFSPRGGITQSLMLSVAAAAAMTVLFISWRSWFAAVFFGYLAYSNFFAMQAYRGRGPW